MANQIKATRRVSSEETKKVNDQKIIKPNTGKKQICTNDKNTKHISTDKKEIDIRSLKQFASKNLPHSSSLREILIQEKDYLSINEFIFKMDIWLKLLKSEVK